MDVSCLFLISRVTSSYFNFYFFMKILWLGFHEVPATLKPGISLEILSVVVQYWDDKVHFFISARKFCYDSY